MLKTAPPPSLVETAGMTERARGFIRCFHLGFVLSLMLTACVSDTQLLEENAPIALQTATKAATRDLNCPQTAASIVSDKEVPGTPLDRLWSLYTINAKGCGKEVMYSVECTDKKICSLKR